MQANPSDDFTVFKGNEHMFFGLKKPCDFIRKETETVLQKQVSDTVLERIQTFGVPKYLTLGRKTRDEKHVLVTYFGFCVRAKLYVNYYGGSTKETIDATLTFLFGNVDRAGADACRTHFDFHDGAKLNFDDDRFRKRFYEFRLDTLIEPPTEEAVRAPSNKVWWRFWRRS